MKRPASTLTLAAIAAACALTAGQVWAESDDQAEVQQFLKAPQSLTAAIQTAESSTGGKAFAVEYSDHKGTGLYEVKTLTGDKLAEVKIDAATGQITKTKDKGLLSERKGDDTVDPAQMPGSLIDLVAKAEQQGGGKVMAIDHESENGVTSTEVEIAATDGTVKTYTWDATGAKLVPLVHGQGDASEDGEANEG